MGTFAPETGVGHQLTPKNPALMEKTIYLIRHGETDYNRRGVVQGSGVDADLNTMGRAQARAFFQAYASVPFANIYISALRRTRQTVQPFLDAGLIAEEHPGLNEISWGVMEGKIPNSHDNVYYHGLMLAWAEGRTDTTTDGGESPQQVMDRQRPVIGLILSRTDENPVLVCMHGRAMRILLAWLTNRPLSAMDQFDHSNLCLYRLRYDYATATFTVDLTNDTTHLLTALQLA
jgi:broad specificity phosphatase PhoE